MEYYKNYIRVDLPGNFLLGLRDPTGVSIFSCRTQVMQDNLTSEWWPYSFHYSSNWCTIGPNVLIAGGFLEGSANCDYVLADYRNAIKVKSGNINEGRYWHGICYSSYHKKGYVVFGSNGVKSIEEYDLSEDCWTKMKQWSGSPSDTMAKAYKSALYITIYNHSFVLKFDPETQAYQQMQTFNLTASTYKGILDIDDEENMIVCEKDNIILVNPGINDPIIAKFPISVTNTFIKDKAVKANGNFYFINYNLEIIQINCETYEAQVVGKFKN